MPGPTARDPSGRPLRVLHVTATNQRRGAEVFAADLAGALQHDLDQRLVHLRPVAGPTVDFPCPERCLSRATGRLAFVTAIGTLRAEAAAFRPDVVQAHGGEALRLAVVAGLGRRTPVVYRRIGMARPSMLRGWRRRWHRALMGRAAAVACVSEAVRRETAERFDLDPRRVVTIPNAVDPDRLAVSPWAAAAARADLGVPADALLVVSLGALTWEKDPLGMIEVTAERLRTDERARHLFVGDGPLRRPLVERVGALGLGEQVVVAGARDDVGAVLAASDVVLFASRPDGMEGMPATVIEAGLAGRPVVAAAVAGVPEVVVDGATGVLVAPGDRAALASAVAGLLDDPERRRALGAAAADRCRQRFTMEVVAPEYRRLWDGVTRGRVAGRGPT